MAVVNGVNMGFVITAPTVDPEGDGQGAQNQQLVTRDTSQSDATTITEVGWWCDTATEEGNFEVGLYDNDGTAGAAGTLLQVERTNAKGTTAGWKTVSVSWSISSSKEYWIGMQLDNGETTFTNRGGTGVARDVISAATLEDPFNGGAFSTGNGFTIYALTDGSAAGGTNMQLNIGDDFKPVLLAKLNIGDDFKDVLLAKQNIGDVWKDVF